MSARIRIGVVGAGLIAQWEHIPNLIRLSDRFILVGVCDPSVRANEFAGRHFGVPTFVDSDQLLAERLDAVLIASPDFTHVAETLKALAAGLHVFCEKPLCYGPSEADAVMAARDAAGKVVQVGYMKRHDPAYEACLDLLPEDAGKLRFISVEVNDPDSWPFTEAHPYVPGGDVAPDLIAAGRAEQARQVEEALGFTPSPMIARGFAERLCSSLVHDVNATAGLLERLGVSGGEIAGATFFAAGDGGTATIRLLDGQAAWQMTHVVVPGVADYRERIALYFDDRILELRFPSPYLNHFPTGLTVRQSDGRRLDTHKIRVGYGEAFVNELEAFWASVTTGAPVRNSVEQARRDQSLLCDLARHAAGLGPRSSAARQDIRNEAAA